MDHIDSLDIVLTDHDAIFVATPRQVELAVALGRRAAPQLITLSIDAYNAACSAGATNIVPFFRYLESSKIERAYATAESLCATWYRTISGADLSVCTINIPDIDRMNQFLLFAHILNTQNIVLNIIADMPSVNTFYVFSSEEFVTAELYGFGDITAGTIKFTCDQANVRAKYITVSNSILGISKENTPRPHSNRSVVYSIIESNHIEQNRARVGFASAWVLRSKEYYDALREMGHDIVFFHSALGYYNGIQYSKVVIEPNFEEHVAKFLRCQWENFQKAALDEKIPAAIFRNPEIYLQFKYIITERWLGFITYIFSAQQFVSNTPLELLIYSNSFTFEGNALAHLYKNSGTDILEVPHTRWPLDYPERAHVESIHLVFSRSAAEFMRCFHGFSNIQVAHVSKASPNERAASTRSAGGKKVLMLLLNSPDLNSLPLYDIKTHLSVLSHVADVPPHLRDRIEVAIRVKRGAAGEVAFYRNALGLPAELFARFEGCSFDECIDMADCVAGVNCPTGGYCEVLERSVPLVDVQIAMLPCYATTAAPDFLRSIVGRITNLPDFWAHVEMILFDESYRNRILEIQRRFIAYDQPEQAPAIRDIVKALLAPQTSTGTAM
jgi:hypothetical protein